MIETYFIHIFNLKTKVLVKEFQITDLDTSTENFAIRIQTFRRQTFIYFSFKIKRT